MSEKMRANRNRNEYGGYRVGKRARMRVWAVSGMVAMLRDPQAFYEWAGLHGGGHGLGGHVDAYVRDIRRYASIGFGHCLERVVPEFFEQAPEAHSDLHMKYAHEFPGAVDSRSRVKAAGATPVRLDAGLSEGETRTFMNRGERIGLVRTLKGHLLEAPPESAFKRGAGATMPGDSVRAAWREGWSTWMRVNFPALVPAPYQGQCRLHLIGEDAAGKAS